MTNKTYTAKVKKERCLQSKQEIKEDNNLIGVVAFSILLSICFFSECSKIKIKKQTPIYESTNIQPILQK